MATQSYIIAHENVIIEAVKLAKSGQRVDMELLRQLMQDTSEAYQIEEEQGGNSRNRDCWSTLGINALELGRVCPVLEPCCKALADLVGIFG